MLFICLVAAIKHKYPKKDIESTRKESSKEAIPEDETITENKDDEYAFIDLETTGLSPYACRIIEAAIITVRVKDGSAVEFSCALANPGKKIPQRITDITGITDEMVEKADPSDEVVRWLIEKIGDRTVFAYNAKFDIGFIVAAADRMDINFTNKYVCIMEYVKHEHPYLDGYSLEKVCNAFNVRADVSEKHGLSPHRALFDAERALNLTMKIFNGEKPAIRGGACA